MEEFPPYVIEVKQEDIGKVLLLMKENNLLDRIKVTTVLGDEFLSYELEDMITNRKQELSEPKFCCNDSYSKRYNNKSSVAECKICKKVLCNVHRNTCKFCGKNMCESHTTISFMYNHATGDTVCKECDK